MTRSYSASDLLPRSFRITGAAFVVPDARQCVSMYRTTLMPSA